MDEFSVVAEVATTSSSRHTIRSRRSFLTCAVGPPFRGGGSVRVTNEVREEMERNARYLLKATGNAMVRQSARDVLTLCEALTTIIRDANTVLDHIPIEEFAGYFTDIEVVGQYEEDQRGF